MSLIVGLARHNCCAGIHVRPVSEFSDPATQRWAAGFFPCEAVCAEFCGMRDLRQARREQKQRLSPTAVFSSFLSPILQALPCGRSRTSALAKVSPLELCRPSTHPASLAVQRQDFFSWPQAYQIKVRGHAKATAKRTLDIYLGAYVYLLRRLSTGCCMEVI
jgi:hypothetical protein